MRNPKRKLKQYFALGGLALALMAGAAKAQAADFEIYTNASIPVGGGAAVSPNGNEMAYFFFAENGSGYFDTRNTNPSPQGSFYMFSTVGANASFGGQGTAFIIGGGNNTQKAVNLSDYAGGALKFYLKSDRTLQLVIQYDNGSGGLVESNAVNINSTGGAWQEISIALSAASFGAGVDFSKIRVPFLLKIPSAYGTETQISVDYIRWTEPTSSTIKVFPKSTRMNPGQRRMFLIEGVTTPTLSLNPSNLGSLNTTTGNQVIVTANSTIQNGKLQIVKGADNNVSSITVTNANIAATYGIVSETVAGVTLGTDAGFFPYTGGGATINTSNDTGDFREGTFSVKTDLTVGGGGQYAGWAVEWTQTSSLDMNEYFDGSLRFWFKGPSQLQNDLQVGIRSSNVAAGAETSKVSLKNYTTFDNTWRAVVIPIEDFAGLSPKADLSRTRVLVNFLVANNSGGSRTFWVDNIRWDTKKPGALAKIAVSPNPVTVPLSTKRVFNARGLDANGNTVDIWPTWSKTGSIGNIAPAQGLSTTLTAAASAANGSITATDQSISSTTLVSVANIVFNNSFNVYSDLGPGGFVGASQGGTGSNMALNELTGTPPEGSKFMRATMTVGNTAGQTDGFALWFVEEPSGTRFLHFFSNGYLQFYVKTPVDLQVAIRSANIPAGSELSKVRLSDFGVPLDNNYQKVVIPLDYFKQLDPRLDFDNMKTFFAIGGIATQIGTVSNTVFDVDDVKWLSNSGNFPDEQKIYNGLKAKQHPTTGLVLTFDNDSNNRSVTYDQALAAMAYTYRRTDAPLAKKVFDVYKSKFDAGGFAGFHNEYQWDNPNTIKDFNRTTGPNAFMLLALVHYKNVTGSTLYDPMMAGIANWLLSLQDADGGIRFGAGDSNKSTEQNFDTYAAFRAYAKLTGNNTYNTAANNVFKWLSTEAYNGTRFNVGELANGSPNTDKALDVYSWAPLALSSYTNVMALVDTDFRNTKNSATTGLDVDGYDFSGPPGPPYGLAPDKDAVWLEGTAGMALAWKFIGNETNYNHFIGEMEKAVFVTGTETQGMAYATNIGTAYGFSMDASHAAISSMAWYIFAKRNFNPFNPMPMFSVQAKNISNNAPAGGISWTANIPVSWVRANQYIELNAQAITVDNAWGIQIYTDNKNQAYSPYFVDPTPGKPNNVDSNPAGLLVNTGAATSSYRIEMAWRIQDSTVSAPIAIKPFALGETAAGPTAFNWFYFIDKGTPDIDFNNDGIISPPPADGEAFQNGADYIIARTPTTLHDTQGQSGYAAATFPDFIYVEANFDKAAAQTNYKGTIVVEFFLN